MGMVFAVSGRGPESACHISAKYKFFPGFNVFCRISIGLHGTQMEKSSGQLGRTLLLLNINFLAK